MEAKFYTLSAEDKKDCIRIQTMVEYETLKILGKESILVGANTFTIASGKKWFDVAQFDDSQSFAISKRVKQLLERNNVTGWSCFPILIDSTTQEYFGFQILSSAGPILNLDALNNYETELTEFDINTWDGSDIFTMESTLRVVCTSRVKKMLKYAKISNLHIKPM